MPCILKFNGTVVTGGILMTESKRSSDELAEGVQFAANTFVKTFFWLWSLVFGLIAVVLFFGELRLAAALMLGTALLCNPSFIQYGFNEAAKEGKKPPSIFLIFGIAFAFFCASIVVAVN